MERVERVERGILSLATEILNNATYTKDGEEVSLLCEKCVLVDDDRISYAIYMDACESVPQDLENFFPDHFANVYNTLKDAIDNGSFVLPNEQEINQTKQELKNLLQNETIDICDKTVRGKDPIKSKTNSKFTRRNCFVEAIKIGGSPDEIISNMDKIYVENGGNSNIKESKWLFRRIMPILIELRIVKNIDGKFLING